MLFKVFCFKLTESQPKLSIGEPSHAHLYDFTHFRVGDHSLGAQGAEQIVPRVGDHSLGA